MLLKVQKLDRRMSGNRWFKYRVEFHLAAFRDTKIGDLSVYGVRVKVFSDIMKGLTNSLGYGPYVDYTHHSSEAKWAYRIADNRHNDTIYLTEEALAEYEKIMTFLTIKYSG